MANLRMKTLLTEKSAKNSPAELGLKKQADKNWKYGWDSGANHGYLEYKDSEVFIFAPYDVEKDEEHLYYDVKPKGKIAIQVGDSYGRINKVTWYSNVSAALKDIKNLKAKYAKLGEKMLR